MINMTIKTLDGKDTPMSIEEGSTVKELKEKIAAIMGVPIHLQRLIFCGRVLQDESNLDDYDLNNKALHMVQRPQNAPLLDRESERERDHLNPRRVDSPNENANPVNMNLESIRRVLALASAARGTDNDDSPGLNLSPTASRLDFLRIIIEEIRDLVEELKRTERTDRRDYPPEPVESTSAAAMRRNEELDAAVGNTRASRGYRIRMMRPQPQTPPRDFAQIIEELHGLEREFARYRDLYMETLREVTDAVPMTEPAFQRKQRQAEICSELYHSFSHAYHAISDIGLQMSHGNARLVAEPMLRQPLPMQTHINVVQTSNVRRPAQPVAPQPHNVPVQPPEIFGRNTTNQVVNIDIQPDPIAYQVEIEIRVPINLVSNQNQAGTQGQGPVEGQTGQASDRQVTPDFEAQVRRLNQRYGRGRNIVFSSRDIPPEYFYASNEPDLLHFNEPPASGSAPQQQQQTQHQPQPQPQPQPQSQQQQQPQPQPQPQPQSQSQPPLQQQPSNGASAGVPVQVSSQVFLAQMPWGTPTVEVLQNFLAAILAVDRIADIQVAEQNQGQGDSQVQRQGQSQAEPQLQGQTVAQAQGQNVTQSQGQDETQSQVQSQVQAMVQSQGQAEVQSQPQAKDQTHDQAEAESQGKAKDQSKNQAEAQSQGQPQGQSQGKYDSQLQGHEDQTQSQAAVPAPAPAKAGSNVQGESKGVKATKQDVPEKQNAKKDCEKASNLYDDYDSNEDIDREFDDESYGREPPDMEDYESPTEDQEASLDSQEEGLLQEVLSNIPPRAIHIHQVGNMSGLMPLALRPVGVNQVPPGRSRFDTISVHTLVYDRFMSCDSQHARRQLARRRDTASNSGGLLLRESSYSRIRHSVETLYDRFDRFANNQETLMIAIVVTLREATAFSSGRILITNELQNLRVRLQIFMRGVLNGEYAENTQDQLADIIFQRNYGFLRRIPSITPVRETVDIVESMRAVFVRFLNEAMVVLFYETVESFCRRFRIIYPRLFYELCGIIHFCCLEGVQGLRNLHRSYMSDMIQDIQEPVRDMLLTVSQDNLDAAIFRIEHNKVHFTQFIRHPVQRDVESSGESDDSAAEDQPGSAQGACARAVYERPRVREFSYPSILAMTRMPSIETPTMRSVDEEAIDISDIETPLNSTLRALRAAISSASLISVPSQTPSAIITPIGFLPNSAQTTLTTPTTSVTATQSQGALPRTGPARANQSQDTSTRAPGTKKVIQTAVDVEKDRRPGVGRGAPIRDALGQTTPIAQGQISGTQKPQHSLGINDHAGQAQPNLATTSMSSMETPTMRSVNEEVIETSGADISLKSAPAQTPVTTVPMGPPPLPPQTILAHTVTTQTTPTHPAATASATPISSRGAFPRAGWCHPISHANAMKRARQVAAAIELGKKPSAGRGERGASSRGALGQTAPTAQGPISSSQEPQRNPRPIAPPAPTDDIPEVSALNAFNSDTEDDNDREPIHSSKNRRQGRANRNKSPNQHRNVRFVPSAQIAQHWADEWVPTITRDMQRQEEAGSEPFSDAYLAGMPPKKRRCVRQSRPPSALNALLDESVAAVVPRLSVGRSVELSAAFREHVRALTRARAAASQDYDPDRWTATAKFLDPTRPTTLKPPESSESTE